MKLSKIALAALFFATTANAQFVTVKDNSFFRDGKPYHYAGANYWYGALLASDAYGDKQRLSRELDQLKAQGIDNLRVLVGAEGGSYDFTVPYALQPNPGEFNDAVLEGLDYLLSEMGKRAMVAVLYLTNNWEWSGGMSQYLEWNGAGKIPNPNLGGENTWPKFMDYVSGFHSCGLCVQALDQSIAKIIGRTNRFTGKPYNEDSAIMAWQIANEPRIFKVENEKAFTDWLNHTVDLIDRLDSNHLICTGSEGKAGSNDDIAAYARTHANPRIDYLTMHIWPKNWSWYDHKQESATLTQTLNKTGAYIDEHLEVAGKLHKPIVIEEFGLPRRDESLDSGTDVSSRNVYYEYILSRLVASHKEDGLLNGINFWGYSGEGRLRSPSGKWNIGDAFTADPPQEPQGLNSVFDTDAATLKLIRKANARLR